MRLKTRQITKYLKFLNKHKTLVGFSDWNTFIGIKTKKLNSALATIICDSLEKTMMIKLSDEFVNLKNSQQANILLHELLHGRVSVMREFQEKGDNIFFEEMFVNDIVRGFEMHKQLKF
jgi:hypothetical protein